MGKSLGKGSSKNGLRRNWKWLSSRFFEKARPECDFKYFQIPTLFIGKCTISSQFPGLEFCGVRGLSGVVI
jgi:hypothetical protein